VIDVITAARGLVIGTDLARRRASLAAIVGCAALGAGYVGLVDPRSRHAVLPVCPTKLLTGLDCPACGGLRMVHDLLGGHLAAAAHDDLFLLLVSPLVGYLLVRAGRVSWRGDRAVVPARLGYLLLGTAVVWTVLRNLPGWPLQPGGT
jgi:hypothetical protein